MTGAVLAAGLNLTTYSGAADQLGNTYKASDRNGAALPKDCLIQIVKGSAGAPDPAKGGFISSGTLYTNYPGSPALVGHQNTGVTAVDNIAGEFDYNCNGEIDPGGAEAFYVRVWSTAAPAQGAYYNTKGGSLKGAGQSPTDMLWDLKTVYKADEPMKPKSAAGNFSLSYDSTKSLYLPTFTISAVEQADPDGKTLYEVIGYNIRIRKEGDAWDAARTFAAGSKSIVETNTETPYFLADGATWYEIQSQAYNYFGGGSEADWGEIYRFQIPSSGGMVSVPKEFTFKEPVSDQYVSPTSMCFASIGADIAKASDLAKKINAANTAVSGFYVTVIYQANKFDAAGNNLFAAFDASGKVIDGTDFEMEVREPIQVYTSKAGTITL
ncbi:MAG: hypothetical protein MUC35_07595 [Candidatus Margulisbacteria bacterium]|nr:hypothetical protein [Candidatus Margulisiibacteriota bacterium]